MSFDPIIAFSLIVALILAATVWWWFDARQAGPATDSFGKIKTQTLETGSWFIRYHQSGRGPHLVLLHGIGANLFCWRWIIPILCKDFTVTALDLPGFGQSSKPLDASYGLDDQCERLEKIFAQLGIRDSYIVGNSMGGNIALWYALNHPDQVRGLALIAPATSARLIPLALERWAWLSLPIAFMLTRTAMRWAHGRTVSKTQLVDMDRVEETFRTYGGRQDAVRSFMKATSAIRDHRLNQQLEKLIPRVLILWGSKDKLVNRKVIDTLEAALPKAESHVHIGGGHHLQEDEPEWVADHLTAFFKSSV